jgi:hypothetical protein
MLGLSRAPPVGLCKLSALYPELESAWFQPSNLKCDILISKLFAVKLNLYRYTPGAAPRENSRTAGGCGRRAGPSG